MSTDAIFCLVSVIIPVLNEESSIAATLNRFESQAGPERQFEVVIADGGSRDRTLEIASRFDFAQIIQCQKANRGWQMNEGADRSTGEILLFIHADVKLPGDALAAIRQALADERISGGCFQIRFPTGVPLSLRLVAWGINLRTRLFKTATGDQAIFLRRRVFDDIGGYKTYPLMEDIALFNDIKRQGEVAILDEEVEISPRRWLHYGVWRTVLLMYLLRFGFWLGVSPENLKRFFLDVR